MSVATSSIFGPIVTGGDVESWVMDLLRKWLSTYIAEVERQHLIRPAECLEVAPMNRNAERAGARRAVPQDRIQLLAAQLALAHERLADGAPPPGAGSAATWPCMASTSSWTMANPRPEPLSRRAGSWRDT